jgi:polar amino acid transport system permease protein
MIWDWSYVVEIFPALLSGLVVTIRITFFAVALALSGGLLLAILQLSPVRLISLPTRGFIEFVRSTPLLVQLYFLFFVLPDIGIVMSPEITGIIGLGLHFSAYTAEVYRAGIQGVAQGQYEAAKALNLSRYWTFRSIVLPQAVTSILPALGNYSLSMFKETSLLISISVIELLGTAEHLAYETYKYFEPLTMVGILFFCVTYPTSLLLRWLERWLARKMGKAT